MEQVTLTERDASISIEACCPWKEKLVNIRDNAEFLGIVEDYGRYRADGAARDRLPGIWAVADQN